MHEPDTKSWAELADLFDEISELETGERVLRVQELRERRPALASRLQALLVADAAASGLLERSLEEVAPGLHETLLGNEWETRAGLVLGRYRLLEPIGSGGMGEVWRGERADGEYRQIVAVKLLKRGMDTQAILRRFLQERSILARLQHPGIVRLLDGGMSTDGRPYYVMEHVLGSTVTDYAKLAKLDVRARVSMIATIAEAVGFAHAHLIVHRDIKPSNVVVDAEGAPHLLDFGIAKLLEVSAEHTQTGTGVRVLSPAYAAPEQILGETVGTATDVYALGVLLYELLTGELPHRRVSRDPGVLAAELGNESVEKPSHAIGQGDRTALLYGHTDAKRVSRELSGDLDLIVATATRSEPQRRYATMAAFADDLRRWLERRPINARADTAGYRLRKFVRRHRLGVAAAAMISMALIGGLGIALWQAGVARDEAARADAETHRAEREAQAARESAKRGGRVKEFVMSIFLQEDPLNRKEQGPLSLGQAFTDLLARVDTELADDPALQADLLDDFGEVEAGRGKLDVSQRLFERALALAEKAHGPEHPAVAESLLNLGILASYRGEAMAGRQPLERAIAILEKHADDEPEKLSAALIGMAPILQLSGRLDEVVTLAERVLAINRHVLAPGDLRLVVSLQNYAIVLLEVNRYEEAERLLIEAIELIEHSHGASSPNLIFPLGAMTLVRYRQGRYAEQLAVAERELAIAKAAYPGDHAWTAHALGNVGAALIQNGDFTRADANLRASIAMFRRVKSSRVAEPLGTLASLQLRLGDAAGAHAGHVQAVQACRDGGLIGSTMCQNFLAFLAASEARDRPEAALAEIDEVERVVLAGAGARSDARSKVVRARALALTALERYADALVVQRELVALDESIYGPTHEETLRARATLDDLVARVAVNQ